MHRDMQHLKSRSQGGQLLKSKENSVDDGLNLTRGNSLPTEAVDSYHLACLVYESYNHRFETTDSLLSQKGSIPPNMLTIYKNLLSPSYRNRATADMFLDDGLRPRGFFSTDFVNVNLFLENISIKEQSEKEGFFR
jgi:SCY1-like protein 1